MFFCRGGKVAFDLPSALRPSPLQTSPAHALLPFPSRSFAALRRSGSEGGREGRGCDRNAFRTNEQAFDLFAYQ